jgi:hypothetical protein
MVVFAVFTLILALVLTKIDNMISGPSGMGISYLQLSFSKQSFLRVISLWGDYGVSLFLKTVWLDFIYPLTYSMLIAGGLAITEYKLTESGKVFSMIGSKIYLLPFAAAFFDFIENTLHIYIIINKFYNEYIILCASIISSIKWFIIIFSLIIFLKRYFAFRKIMKGEV